MTYCHRHNLVRKDKVGAERNYGIRVTLPSTDTFTRMLGDDWENLHWYATEEERDRAFADNPPLLFAHINDGRGQRLPRFVSF